ncbi:MAG: helix-turn-helix domain-containing protein [candidate division Zixibacteria bacterium]|nr:helix-turn-helix domain-containing protein [candidate division Zixibacteria bacterium]
MDAKKLREIAIRRYQNGESPKEIYQSLGKSEAWFFKWLKRFRLDGEEWTKDQSRRPHRIPKRIDEDMEQILWIQNSDYNPDQKTPRERALCSNRSI